MNSAKGSLGYLLRFFEEVKVPFKYDSRADIETSFDLAKETRKDSQLFG